MGDSALKDRPQPRDTAPSPDTAQLLDTAQLSPNPKFHAGPADTLFRVQTPEGIEYSLNPAGLPVRLFAYGIDLIFQALILMIFFIVYFFILKRMAGIWLILLVRFALEWFYFVFWELLWKGQSPGKRFLGIRTIRNDGSPIGAGASFIRNLLRFADSFMGLFFVVFISSVLSRGFRRPGDWAAGTLVIYTWESQTVERRRPVAYLAAIPPETSERPLSSEEKQGLLMFARRYPLLGPARAEEIAGPMAASLRNGAPVPGEDGKAAATEYLLGIARTFAGDAV